MKAIGLVYSLFWIYMYTNVAQKTHTCTHMYRKIEKKLRHNLLCDTRIKIATKILGKETYLIIKNYLISVIKLPITEPTRIWTQLYHIEIICVSVQPKLD